MSLEEKLKTCNDELNIYKKMFHLTPDKEFNFFKCIFGKNALKNI